MELQLKCTGRDDRDGGPLAFELKRKNYDDLIPANFGVPRILVVVFIPEGDTGWLSQTHEELVMRHSGYWVSLRGLDELPPEQTTKTVHIPKNQVFAVDQLQAMMDRCAQGDLP